jgi:hypothetical protein
VFSVAERVEKQEMTQAVTAAKNNILKRIKNAIEQGAASEKFKKLFMIRGGQTKRIRFVSDMEDGIPVVMHQSWETLYPTPCQSYFGKDCPYCENEEYKTNEWYAWTVRDLDEKKRKVFAYNPAGRGPIPYMIERYEKYGTLCDRAYEIKKRGERQNVSWDLVPEGGKVNWKKQFKPFTAETIYEVLNASGGPKGKAKNKEEGEDTSEE